MTIMSWPQCVPLPNQLQNSPMATSKNWVQALQGNQGLVHPDSRLEGDGKSFEQHQNPIGSERAAN